MKSIPIWALLILLSAGLSPVASAGSQLSPTIRIVVLEVGDVPNVLRLGIRKRLVLDAGGSVLPPYVTEFNPAGCSYLQVAFKYNENSTENLTDFVDIQLDSPARSAEEQQQLLNAVLVSFMTSRSVQLYVRDDLCSISGGRVAVGVVVK